MLTSSHDVQENIRQFEEAHRCMLATINTLRLRGIMIKPLISLQDSQYVYNGYNLEVCTKPKEGGSKN